VLFAKSAVLGRARGTLITEQSQVSLSTIRLVGTHQERSSPSQFHEHISDFKMYCCVEDWFSGSITTSLQESGYTFAERPHNFQPNPAVTDT